MAVLYLRKTNKKTSQPFGCDVSGDTAFSGRRFFGGSSRLRQLIRSSYALQLSISRCSVDNRGRTAAILQWQNRTQLRQSIIWAVIGFRVVFMVLIGSVVGVGGCRAEHNQKEKQRYNATHITIHLLHRCRLRVSALAVVHRWPGIPRCPRCWEKIHHPPRTGSRAERIHILRV